MAALGEFPYFVGIDAGSSSVKVVALRDAGAGFDVAFRACEAHKGSIAREASCRWARKTRSS